jgi:PKD repeat protein
LPLAATPTSSVGASFTKFRWEFGDGARFRATHKPTTDHHYKKAGNYAVRIEATDDLGHRAIGKSTVHITN